MTVSPRALLHLIAILAAAGTFATRATCYAELPWLVRFGRGALAMTVVTGIYSRIGRTGSFRTAAPTTALAGLPTPTGQAQLPGAPVEEDELAGPLPSVLTAWEGHPPVVAGPASAHGDLDRRINCDAGHEIKTPLAGIKAYLELLADGEAVDEATRAEFLNGIGSQVERLERTVEQLLASPDAQDSLSPSPATSLAGRKPRPFAQQMAT